MYASPARMFGLLVDDTRQLFLKDRWIWETAIHQWFCSEYGVGEPEPHKLSMTHHIAGDKMRCFWRDCIFRSDAAHKPSRQRKAQKKNQRVAKSLRHGCSVEFRLKRNGRGESIRLIMFGELRDSPVMKVMLVNIRSAIRVILV